MPTILSVLIGVSFVGIGALAVIIYLDSITQFGEPKYFNFSDGSTDVDGAGAKADHHEDKDTGTIRAEASVVGQGNAQATAKMGQEFQFKGKKPRPGIVAFKLDYRTNVEVAGGNSGKSNAYVKVIPKSKSPELVEIEQTGAGHVSKPSGDGFVSVARKFMVKVMQPGDKVQVYVEAHANSEVTQDGNESDCNAFVECKLAEVKFRPKMLY